MARIFITGSSDGIGALAARKLIQNGHQVVLHARNAQRAKDAAAVVPGAQAVLIGDLSSPLQTAELAKAANELGPYDAVIHNAGLYRGAPALQRNEEGVPKLVAVNSFAPYILTALMQQPKRLVYLSSGLHNHGDPSLKNISMQDVQDSKLDSDEIYANSKFHMVMLASAVARRWPHVKSNSLDPGWVATKMGGKSAPGDINAAVDMYIELATKTEETGTYFSTRGARDPKVESRDVSRQDLYMEQCAQLTGIPWSHDDVS